MGFDLGAKLTQATQGLKEVGLEKAQQALGEMNQTLKLLQAGGYRVNQLDLELGLPPTVTVDLRTSAALSESKLRAALPSNGGKDLASIIIGTLIEANKLRGSIDVDTLELQGAKIVLKTTPTVTLLWKDKTDGKAAV